jgi:hypothetical protein
MNAAGSDAPDVFLTSGQYTAQGFPARAPRLSDFAGAVSLMINPGVGFGLALNATESPTDKAALVWVEPGVNWCPVALLSHFYLVDHQCATKGAHPVAGKATVSCAASVAHG